MPAKIFFCYAHEDELLLNKLKTHLRPLERQKLIEMWYDRNISAGTVWEEDIKKHLNEADIILLLISPSFIASEYCYGIELQRAVERHNEGDVRVIPIILEYVYWKFEPLSTLQALPVDAKPIMSANWHSQNEAFYNVVEGVRKVVENLKARHLDTPIKPTEQPNVPPIPPVQPLPENASQQSQIPPTSAQILKTLQLKYVLTEHSREVTSVAISPDGQTFVSSSNEETIRVWNLQTGVSVRTLKNYLGGIMSTEAIGAVAIGINGQTFVSGGIGHTIGIWNIHSGELLHTLTGHEISLVSSVAISPDGQTLVSGGVIV